MLIKKWGCLIGIKWIGDDGAVLVAAGTIDDDKLRDDPGCVFQSFTLSHNQRLVGIRAKSGSNYSTGHASF